MKPITGVFLSATLVVAFGCTVGCNSDSPTKMAANSSAQTANFKSVTFFVDGMV